MIPYSRQTINQQDIKAVTKAIKSNFIARGPLIEKFEKTLAKKVKAKYGLAVNSATSALHVACLALGLKKGDIVWTVPNTFVASANCARYCGASVDFVDINSSTLNIDTQKLEKKLKKAKSAQNLPKIIIPVHFTGQPTEQEKIWNLAKKFKFKVIEDASHSLGGKRNGEPVGSCRWSHVTVFSFHPVKIITTAEGGMALTNNYDLYKKMNIYRNHGITKDFGQMIRKIKSHWYYEQQLLGYNYWITDIQAALGLSQLKNLGKFVKKRNKIAKFYNEKLTNLPLEKPIIQKGNFSSYHLYVVKLKLNKINKTYDNIFKELRNNGIGINLHYLPVHLQPYYQKFGFKKGNFPVAEQYSKTAISLPIYYDLKTDEQMRVVNVLKKILKG